ncbi:MAG TPA: hypothetical protein ENI87_00275 [bacterium]|nr:hypothetical protein [bacterium]
MNAWSIAVRLLAAIVVIAYPALVWLGLSVGSPRTIAIVLLLVMIPASMLRARSHWTTVGRGLLAVPVTVLALLTVSALLDHGGFIRATPVAISAVLLAAFGVTLRRGSMPMIERFARLQEPDLDAAKQHWCRTWTWIWCGFFVANGTAALLFACFASMDWWALYNGLLSYLLIGVLFATEWLLRHRRFPDLRHRRGAKP